MSEHSVVVCDQTGVQITSDMFRVHAVVQYGGGDIPAADATLDFSSIDALVAYVQQHDPVKAHAAQIAAVSPPPSK